MPARQEDRLPQAVHARACGDVPARRRAAPQAWGLLQWKAFPQGPPSRMAAAGSSLSPGCAASLHAGLRAHRRRVPEAPLQPALPRAASGAPVKSRRSFTTNTTLDVGRRAQRYRDEWLTAHGHLRGWLTSFTLREYLELTNGADMRRERGRVWRACSIVTEGL